MVRYDLNPSGISGSRWWTGEVTISPDGSIIARSGGPKGQIIVRRRDQLDFSPIAGTEGAISPVFTADGQRLVFYLNRQLLSMPVTGGALQVVLDSLDTVNGVEVTADWLYTNEPNAITVITRRRLDGTGTPEPVTRLDRSRQEFSHLLPHLHADGKHLLFQVELESGVRRIALGAVENPGQHTYLTDGVRAQFAGRNHVLYTTRDGKLWLAAFDMGSGKLTSEPKLIAEDIPATIVGPVDFYISASGTLVYSVDIDSQRRRLMWVTRAGVRTAVDSSWVGPFSAPVISPDGRRVAVSRGLPNESQVWVKSFAGGDAVQLTTEQTASQPAWSADGKAVSYLASARATNTGDVFELRVTGEGSPRKLAARNAELSEQTRVPDGRVVVRTTTPTKGSGDILVTRAPNDTMLVSMLASAASEYSPSVSPDGRWLAYSANASGVLQIYVQRLDQPAAGRWPVSTTGGITPRWSRDGKELFYRDLNGQLIAAQVTAAPTFAVQQSRVLFDASDFVQPAASRHNYDVAPDGRFLFVQRADGSKNGRMVVIEHFLEEVKRYERK